MDEKEALIFLEKVDSILRDLDHHEISYDYECFGGITVLELALLAKKLIRDYGFNADDFYLPNTKIWFDIN